MIFGTLMIYSARILRSLELQKQPIIKAYLLIVRDLFWPIEEFILAISLSYLFYHQAMLIQRQRDQNKMENLNTLIEDKPEIDDNEDENEKITIQVSEEIEEQDQQKQGGTSRKNPYQLLKIASSVNSVQKK
jgi:hypothetical protein